jgi:hypothetical protein
VAHVGPEYLNGQIQVLFEPQIPPFKHVCKPPSLQPIADKKMII